MVNDHKINCVTGVEGDRSLLGGNPNCLAMFNHEDEGTKSLRNVSTYLPIDTA